MLQNFCDYELCIKILLIILFVSISRIAFVIIVCYLMVQEWCELSNQNIMASENPYPSLNEPWQGDSVNLYFMKPAFPSPVASTFGFSLSIRLGFEVEDDVVSVARLSDIAPSVPTLLLP